MFRIALRNLLRHGRRSALSLVAIVGVVVALLLAGGFIQWIFHSIRESTIKTPGGHIQIAKAGFVEAGSRDRGRFVIPTTPDAIRTIEAMPEVTVVAPRLAITGLLSHGERTASFPGDALSPDLKRALSSEIVVRAGQDPDNSDFQGIIVGEGLTEHLKLKVGDSIVLFATTPGGGISGVDARVRGIFYSPFRAYNDVAILTTLDLGRKLQKSGGAYRFLVLVRNTEDADRVLARITAALDVGLVAMPGHAGADFHHKTVTLFSSQFALAKLVAPAIVLLAISNTMVMAVFERTGEIGTALALGTPQQSLLLQFLLEGLLLAVPGRSLGWGNLPDC